MVGTRLSIAQSALTRIDGAASTVKNAAANATSTFTATGQTIDQITAQGQLGQIIDALNVQVGNQYIFSGDQPPSSGPIGMLV